jgi:hypothetical protein
VGGVRSRHRHGRGAFPGLGRHCGARCGVTATRRRRRNPTRTGHRLRGRLPITVLLTILACSYLIGVTPQPDRRGPREGLADRGAHPRTRG